MTSRPEISVVVSVYKDPRIERCILSLLDQSLERNRYEIIIVESGSFSLKEFCDHNKIVYLNLQSGNLPIARNLGLKNANADIVLFTDSDCIIDHKWLEEMLNCFVKSENDIAGIGGLIKRFNPITPVELWGSNIVDGQAELNYLPILPFPYIVTANAGYRRNILLEIGGFDENLISGNDVDICYKLGLKGFKLRICSSAIVHHENRKTVKGHFKRFVHYGKYQSLLFKNYKHISKRRILITKYPFACVGRSILSLPAAIINFLLRKDSGLLWQTYLLFIEGVGLIYGGISGSIKHRVLYI